MNVNDKVILERENCCFLVSRNKLNEKKLLTLQLYRFICLSAFKLV